MILLLLVGCISGIISGMGIGGGTVLIPALILLTDLTQQQAQGINLFYFIPTAIIALYFHKKNGVIEKSVVKPIVLWGFIGAIIGSLIAIQLDAQLLKKFFGVFLFVMGITEFFKKDKKCNQIEGGQPLKIAEFEILKRQFAQADTQKKIELYTTATGIDKEQYLELLRMFPIEELPKLEEALTVG